MAQTNFNTSFPNDGLGDKLRDAFLAQQAMNTELYANKVDKVVGKDLSDNNYTNEDKAKVDALTGNEEQNVQSDWNELDPTSDAFIIGKPIFSTDEILVSAIWTGTGLNYNVTADAFPINGVSYPATPAQVTLNAADPVLDRIDLIVAIKPIDPLTVGTVGKITGTPASTALAVPPDYDPSLYYVIKQVTVRAAATTPEGAVNTIIFNEGGEWTPNLTANLTVNSSDPSVGANCIESTNNTTADYAHFDAGYTLNTANLDLLEFDLKLKEAVFGKSFFIELWNAGVRKTKSKFTAPQANFDDSNLSYQRISLNKSLLNLPIIDYDAIRIRPFWTNSGYYLDNIKIYAGSGAETVPDTGIPDAPNDGKLYGRQSLSWAEIVSTLTEQEKKILLAGTSSGLLTGGYVTVNSGDNSKIDIAAGSGVLIDRYTDPENPVLTYVSWTDKIAVPVTYLATNTSSHVFIDVNGDVYQQTTRPSGQDRREYIVLDQIGHSNNTSVSGIVNNPQLFSSPIDFIRDIVSYLGVLSSGNEISANGANLSINKSEGTLLSEGINNDLNPFNPNIKSFALYSAPSIRRRTQTGNGTTATVLDVGNYDLGGTITALAANKYTNQRVFMLTNGNIVVQYGQVIYNSLSEAVLGVSIGAFVLFPNLAENAKLLCVISVKSTATNLSDPAQASFSNISGFGGSTGGEPSAVLSFNGRTGEITLTNNDIEDVITASSADTLESTSVIPFVKSGFLRKISWTSFITAIKNTLTGIDISLNTTNFNNNLGINITDVQELADTVDNLKIKEYTKIHPSSKNIIRSKILKYKEQYPKGLFLGNSIMQGVGASAESNRIPNKFVSKLGSYFGISVSNFDFNNYGVGGATSAICLSYIANAFNDNIAMSRNNEINKGNYDYAVLLPLRNDEARYTKKTTEEILKTTILNLRNQGLDVYLIVDLPKIDVNGDIVDSIVFQNQLDAAYAAADLHGANLVDVWGYFKNMYDRGIDISIYYNDLVHPNDAGHDLIAELLLECVKRVNVLNASTPPLQYEAACSYLRESGANNLQNITGLSTEATSRELELEEIIPQAYSLVDTENMSFKSPIPCYAIVVNVIGNSGGTLSGTYAGVDLGINLTDGGGSVREFAHYIRLTSPLSGQKSSLVLTSSGNTRITGVTFIGMSNNQEFYRVPEYTSNTTPTNQTFINGIKALQMGSDGNFIEFDLYGEQMDMSYEERSVNGIFDLYIDNVLYNTYDAYNVSRTKKPINVPLGELKWHKIKIQINGKNASSGGFTCVFGDFKVYSNAFSKYIYFDDRSTSIDLRYNIKKAKTIKNITNTLEAYKNHNKNIITNSNLSIGILDID